MKYAILGTIALIVSSGTAMAEDLLGNWRTAADDNGNSGLVEVVQCGSSLCGTLVQAFDANGNSMESENVGRQIIWDTNPTGTPGEYRGRVYSPDRDREYASRLQLDGDVLAVSGCVLGICRDGGRWQRAN